MSNERIAQILLGMIELLSDRTRWTQGYSARDSQGMGLTANHMCATSWCATGAMTRVISTLDGTVDEYDAVGYVLFDAIHRVIGRRIGIVELNDTMGYEALMQVLRRALYMVQARDNGFMWDRESEEDADAAQSERRATVSYASA